MAVMVDICLLVTQFEHAYTPKYTARKMCKHFWLKTVTHTIIKLIAHMRRKILTQTNSYDRNNA